MVEINTYDQLPSFLEVESPNIDELKHIVELLGFSYNQTKTWTGKEVLDFYNKK